MNQPPTPTNFQLFIRFIHPWMLLAGIVSYILGSGIARYLGFAILDIRFWGGMLAVILLQLASYLLKLYYDLEEILKILWAILKTTRMKRHEP